MNEKQEKMLEEWIYNTQILLKCHYTLAANVRKRYLILGIVSVTLTVVVGSNVFDSFSFDSKCWTTAMSTAAIVVSLFSSVMTAMLAFLKLPEMVQKHTTSGNDYASLRKEMQSFLVMDRQPHESVTKEMKKFRDRWEEIRKNSLPLSNRMIRKFGIKDINKEG
jgi:hypothetical protein